MKEVHLLGVISTLPLTVVADFGISALLKALISMLS